jgi:hypothetical protein
MGWVDAKDGELGMGMNVGNGAGKSDGEWVGGDDARKE